MASAAATPHRPHPFRRLSLLIAMIAANALLFVALMGAFVEKPVRRWVPHALAEVGVEAVFSPGHSPDPFIAIAKSLQRPLRVAIVTHEMARSGAAMMCLELAAMLQRRGAEVSIVVLYVDERGSALPISQQISPGHTFRVSEDGTELLRGQYSAQHYDVVLASSAAANTVNWLERFRRRVKNYGHLLWWLHEGPAVMHEFIPKFTQEAVDALRLGHADGLIFESWHSAQFWLQRASDSRTRLLAPLSRVIHWGLPDQKLAHLARAAGSASVQQGTKGRRPKPPVASVWPRVLLARRGPSRTESNPAVRVFIMVANGNPRKGYEAAFEATRVANYRCGERAGGPRIFLLGVGVTAKTAARDAPAVDLYTLADRYEDYVELVRDAVDPIPLLAASDAFISNGIHGGENFGLSLMEAMATGTPVLATRAGGATEQIVHDVHGFLYASGEVLGERNATVLTYSLQAHARALSHAMCVVVREPARARRWGSAGQRRVQAYLSEGRIMHEFGLLVASLLQLPGRDPNTALPEEDPGRTLVPLALQSAALWEPQEPPSGGYSPRRTEWVAAAAAQWETPGTAPLLSGRSLPALLGRHAAFVVAPAERAAAGSAASPPLAIFALDSSTQTLGGQALMRFDVPEFPRAGVGMAATAFGDGGSMLVIAGGVVSVTDPCATYSAPVWLIDRSSGAAGNGGSEVAGVGGPQRGISRLADLPALLVRPVVVIVQPDAAGRTRGESFAVHVLGGAPVDGDRALSGLHWRLGYPSSPSSQLRAGGSGVSGGASTSPGAEPPSPWERLADVPLPALDPAVVSVPPADTDGHGEGGIYLLGGRIGGPPDPLVLGECVEDDATDDADSSGADMGAGGNAPAPTRRPLSPPPHPLYGAVTAHPLPLAMSSVLRFDAAAGTWAQVADLPVPVWGAVAVVGASGRVVVLGGRTTGGVLTDAVQQYVPEDDRWHVIGAAPLPAPSAGGVAWLGYVAPAGRDTAPVLSVVYAPAVRADCRDLLREPPSPEGIPRPAVAARVCRPGLRPWPRADLPGALMHLALVVPSPVPRPPGPLPPQPQEAERAAVKGAGAARRQAPRPKDSAAASSRRVAAVVDL